MPSIPVPASPYTIRRAVREDAAVLSDLASRTFYDTFKGTAAEEDFEVAMQEWFNPASFEARMAHPVTEVYIAETADGTPAGYAVFRRDAPPFPAESSEGLELVNLYIEQTAHGTGLAHDFMQLYTERAAAQGLRFLWLGVWEHNYRAQRFYTKWGFAPTGHEHPFPIHNTPQTDQWWSKQL